MGRGLAPDRFAVDLDAADIDIAAGAMTATGHQVGEADFIDLAEIRMLDPYADGHHSRSARCATGIQQPGQTRNECRDTEIQRQQHRADDTSPRHQALEYLLVSGVETRHATDVTTADALRVQRVRLRGRSGSQGVHYSVVVVAGVTVVGFRGNDISERSTRSSLVAWCSCAPGRTR